MNSRYQSYISFARIMLILALCFVSGKAWGDSTYYANVKVSITGTAQGKVYLNDKTSEVVSGNDNKISGDSSPISFKLTAKDVKSGYSVNWQGFGTGNETEYTGSVNGTTTERDYSGNDYTHSVTVSFPAITYSISIDLNGGEGYNIGQYYNIEGDTGTDSDGHNLITLLNLNDPTRTGYKFAGWTVTGTKTVWEDSYTTLSNGVNLSGKTGDVTLTAKWHKVYSIKLADGDTKYYTTEGDTGTDSDGHNLITLLNLNDPTRTGYKFAGWTVTGTKTVWEDSYTTLSNGVNLSGKTGDVTLTAKWHKVYSIKLADGDTKYYTTEGDTGTDSDGHNLITSLNLNDPTQTGYKFAGWKVDGGGQGWEDSYTTLSNGVNLSGMTGNVTLTAKWHKVYSIVMKDGDSVLDKKYYTSEADGGTDSDGNTLVQTLTQPDPKKDGNKFTGWTVTGTKTVWEDSYTTLSNGVNLSGKTGDVTLTAKWHKVYSIVMKDGDSVLDKKYYTSEADGGTDSDGNTLVQTLTQPDPKKDGNKFTGWTVTGTKTVWEDSYTTLSNGVNLSGKTGDVTLTAQWELIKYTLTLDPNGGTVNPSSIDNYYITKTFSLPTPEYPGHTFDGWYVFGAADGNWELDKKYTGPQSGMYGTVTLKAKWTTASYKIQYDCPDGAIKDPDPIEYYDIDSSFSLPKNVTKPGYPFVGWKVTDTTTPSSWKIDDAYGPGESFEAGQYGNVTFTAQWGSAISYYISFDLNGGPGSLDDKNYSIESDSVNLPVPPTRNGYEFSGWKPSADSEEDQGNWKSSETYQSGENKLNGKYGDVKLVAQWEAKTYEITYKDNGEVVTTLVPKTYTILSDESLPIYTKSKYAFVGWKVISDSIEGSWNKDDVIKDGTALKDKWGDVIFEAQWEAGKYNITLDCAGGTLDSEYPKMYDSETTLILPKPSKEGCQFLNWKVTNVGEGENNWKVGDTYEAGKEIKGKYGLVTLTAQWNALPGYIKICLTGLKNGNSAIFDVSYKSTTLTIAIDSAECESGVLIEIPEAGAGTDVTVSPKTGWLVNYPGLNTDRLYYIKATEHGTPESAYVFDFGQQSYENNVSETYKEF